MDNVQNYLLDNEVATAPRNSIGTGTITTNKLGVIGVGTLFTQELKRGAYIVNFSTNQVRRISEVVDNTYAILESSFSAELIAVPLPYIKSYKGNVREIGILIPTFKQDNTTANAWGKIDNIDFPPGTGNNYSKANRDRSSSMDVINPVILNATGTQMFVTLTY